MIALTQASHAAFHAGFSVGLAVAVPIGPMGLLCIQRTLAAGLAAGLVTGLGAATVQAAYGAAVITGIQASMIATIEAGTPVLRLVSAAILMMFSARLLCRTVALDGGRLEAGRHLPACYRDALILGLANPLTLILLTAVIPVFRGPDNGADLPAILLGMFCGSVAWWLILTASVSLLRARMDAGVLKRINVAAGLILGLLAVGIAVQALL